MSEKRETWPCGNRGELIGRRYIYRYVMDIYEKIHRCGFEEKSKSIKLRPGLIWVCTWRPLIIYIISIINGAVR